MSAAAASGRASAPRFDWGGGGSWQEVLEKRAFLGSRGIPDLDDVRILAEAGGIDGYQQACCDALLKYPGMERKAKRRALCGRVGRSRSCSGCGAEYYTPFPCNVRYCVNCGPRLVQDLFDKYMGLAPVVGKLLLEHGSRWVLATMDFTVINLGRMLAPKDVKVFKTSIRKLRDRACEELKVDPGDVGLLYSLEYGGKHGPNTNLHAHGIWCGPWLPKPQENGVLKELGEWWRDACKGTVFEGSCRIHAKPIRSFRFALDHALKYPAKYLDSSRPGRLAALEASFHKVRRVVGLGAFYNALPNEKPERKPLVCPRCGDELGRSVQEFVPIPALLRRGAVNFRQAQREEERKNREFYERWAADREKHKAAEREKQGTEAAPVRGSPGVEDWLNALELDLECLPFTLVDPRAAYPD